MKKFLFVPFAAAIALAACSSQDETPDGEISPDAAAVALGNIETPRAGQYEAKIEVLDFNIPGMPAAQTSQMRAMFANNLVQGHSYCLTEAEAEGGAKQMAEALAEGDCSFNKFDVSGNSLDADMICKDENGIQGNVKLNGTMSREGSDITMAMEQKVPNIPGDGVINIRMKMVSARVGDCPAGADS